MASLHKIENEDKKELENGCKPNSWKQTQANKTFEQWLINLGPRNEHN